MNKLVERYNEWAKLSDWNIKQPSLREDLPKEVLIRYGNIPPEWIEFIKLFQEIMNASETMWFLTYESYYEDVWNYNDFELLSLEAASGDEEWKESIRKFWDNNFPIVMSVGGDYQYYAIEMSTGKIVQGWSPELEEVEYVASSFVDFIEKIIGEEIVLTV